MNLLQQWGATIKQARQIILDEVVEQFINSARVQPEESFVAGNKYVLTFSNERDAIKIQKLLNKYRIMNGAEKHHLDTGDVITYVYIDIRSLVGSMIYRTLKQQIDEGNYDKRRFKI